MFKIRNSGFIHNASFDTGFLNAEFLRNGFPTLDALDCTVTCTLKMARRALGLRHNRLDDLCRYYGISLADRTLHGALIDTRLLLDVLKHLRGA